MDGWKDGWIDEPINDHCLFSLEAEKCDFLISFSLINWKSAKKGELFPNKIYFL